MVEIILDEKDCVPAPAQGALAIEGRKNLKKEWQGIIKAALHDKTTAEETSCERTILKKMYGGCTLPLGVRCQVIKDKIFVKCFIALYTTNPATNKRCFHSIHHIQKNAPLNKKNQLLSMVVTKLQQVMTPPLS